MQSREVVPLIISPTDPDIASWPPTGPQSSIELRDQQRTALTMYRYGPRDSGRRHAEAFIADVFKDQHDANLSSFMPILLANGCNTETLSCAVGIREVGSHKIFLEKYLEEPIDITLGHIAKQEVQREQIAEVGNLASTSIGSCRQLFTFLLHYFSYHQTEWVVCTGTGAVRAILEKAGIPHQLIKRAKADKLGSERYSWGTYYWHNPFVLAIHIPTAIAKQAPNYKIVME